MRFSVMRHGKSPSLSEAHVRHDAERPLSEDGRHGAREMAKRLAAQGARPALILTSPLKRAQQTAQEAASVLKPEHGVKVYDPLSNIMTAEILFDHFIRDTEGESEFLGIGHQPQLGELVSYLTGQNIEIRPAGSVLMETDGRGKAKLVWSGNL